MGTMKLRRLSWTILQGHPAYYSCLQKSFMLIKVERIKTREVVIFIELRCDIATNFVLDRLSCDKTRKEKPMVEEARKIVEQALKMPARQRAEIAQRLLESLDRQMDIGVESAWQSEIERRISDLDNGQVACIPWEEVRERLTRNSIEAG